MKKNKIITALIIITVIIALITLLHTTLAVSSTITNDNDVYTTASTLCYLKADGDNKVTVGPITIESAGAEFWINLAERYSKKATELANKNNSTTSSSGYINRLKRC